MPGSSLSLKLKKIRMVLLDVDGVLTDGRITYGIDGKEYKTFDAHDGYGIERAKELGLRIGLVTGRTSAIVERRAKELGITDVFQGAKDKIRAMMELKRKYSLDEGAFAYVGDDEFDLPLLKSVGVSAAPSNAVPAVKKAVDYVTKSSGGGGAVREFLDMVLKEQKKL
jgi:3-deoxy-D-manno-octulosonate 8-phosphate phosphatase (KDO 8-P phosphatase)